MPISRAGSWSKFRSFSPGSRTFSDRSETGFTLIEVLVVLSLLAIMMFFAFPRLSAFIHLNTRDEAARWIIAANMQLKNRALSHQQPHVLRVDISHNRMLALVRSQEEESGSDASGDQEAELEDLSRFAPQDDLAITGVAFSPAETIATGTADIVFHEQGYSDQAVIYMTAGDRLFSFYIAPFLSRVAVYDGHVDFAAAAGRA